MRILVQSIYFPPRLGGIESHVHTLCRGLVARGHEVTVVTSRTEEGGAQREHLDGIDVHRVPLPKKSLWGWTLNAVLTIPVFLRLAPRADIERHDVRLFLTVTRDLRPAAHRRHPGSQRARPVAARPRLEPGNTAWANAPTTNAYMT